MAFFVTMWEGFLKNITITLKIKYCQIFTREFLVRRANCSLKAKKKGLTIVFLKNSLKVKQEGKYVMFSW